MGTAWNAAVLAVVDGDTEKLRALLANDRELVHATSGPPFEARLLHYVAANGVSDELQRTPPNAPEIAKLLLDAGAAPDALGKAYGAGANATALCLLVSSWHPFARGVQSDLVRVLVEGGAQLNGLLDDGAPLTTALTFGYSASARTLADLGARVDNLLLAAGLGKMERVFSFFDASGQAKANALGSYVPAVGGLHSFHPREIAQQAFHFALTHGHEAVASWLLKHGADARGRVVGHHAALPLLQCLFVHRPSMIPFLLDHGADPHESDPKLKVNAIQFANSSGQPKAVALLQTR